MKVGRAGTGIAVGIALVAACSSTPAPAPGAPAPRVLPGEPDLSLSISTSGDGAQLVLTGADRCDDGRGGWSACNTRPVPNRFLRLVLADHGALEVWLGTTGADGVVDVSWAGLAEDVPDGATIGAVFVDTAQAVLGELDLAPARAARAELAWQEAVEGDSAYHYRTYIERFPDLRTDEAQRRFAERRVVEIEAEIRRDLDAGNASTDGRLVDEWRRLDPAAPALAELAPRVAEAELRAVIDDQGARFDEALAEVALDSYPSVSLSEAATALAALEHAAVDHPDVVARRARYDATRTKIIDGLLAIARKKLRANDREAAWKALEQLADIDPDNTPAATLRERVLKNWRPPKPPTYEPQ